MLKKLLPFLFMLTLICFAFLVACNNIFDKDNLYITSPTDKGGGSDCTAVQQKTAPKDCSIDCVAVYRLPGMISPITAVKDCVYIIKAVRKDCTVH